MQLLSKEIWSIHSDGTRHFRPETMACVTPPRCEREPTSAKTPLGPLEMKDRGGGLVFDTLLSAIRPVDRCCHLSVQSDKRARSSSTFAISSWRRGFLASDVSAKSRIRYRASAAASAHVVDGAARACLSNSSWRRRRACLVGLNLVEAPANFSRFLSGHAAMLVQSPWGSGAAIGRPARTADR